MSAGRREGAPLATPCWCFYCAHWPGALTGSLRRVELCREGHGHTAGYVGCSDWRQACLRAQTHGQASKEAP